MATPRQDLADALLPVPLGDWVRERRHPDYRRPWRVIANELRDATGGKVAVTGEALRKWYPDLDDALAEPQGAAS